MATDTTTIGGGAVSSQQDPRQLAERHANEAERLLAGRMGLINKITKAGVHATLAVYYSNQASR
jgi:hypothetical protein